MTTWKDNSELRAFLEQYHSESYGWALACCSRDPLQAEEVLQTVYLKVLEGKARFDGKSSFKTWLFAVIRKTAASEYRWNAFRRLQFIRFEESDEREIQKENLDETLDRSEIQTLLLRALAALSKRQREILHLVFYQGLSIAEAAKVIGISTGAARTHYERGKKRLRQWLQEIKVFDEPIL